MKFLQGIGYVVLYICGLLFGAWAVMLMWQWFIVPLGLPQIGVAQALGVDLLVTYLCYPRRKKGDNSWLELILGAYSEVAFVLGASWIIHLFV